MNFESSGIKCSSGPFYHVTLTPCLSSLGGESWGSEPPGRAAFLTHHLSPIRPGVPDDRQLRATCSPACLVHLSTAWAAFPAGPEWGVSAVASACAPVSFSSTGNLNLVRCSVLNKPQLKEERPHRHWLSILNASGTLLSVFRALSQSILAPTQGGGYFIVPILKAMKPQLTEIK